LKPMKNVRLPMPIRKGNIRNSSRLCCRSCKY
jgi:hypothetical protein